MAKSGTLDRYVPSILRLLLLVVILALPSIPVHASYTGCSDPNLNTGGAPCVEITQCGFFNPPTRTYLLLTQDLRSSMSCLFLGGNLTLDLNNHTIYFVDAAYGTIPNSNFEDWQVVGGKDVPTGWDVSAAPGLRKLSTHTDIPLIGDWLIELPAGQTIVSGWVYLPLANRSYQAMIAAKSTSSSSYVTLSVENSAGATVCTNRLPPENLNAGTTLTCKFRNVPPGNYRLRVTPDRDHYFDLADIRPTFDLGITVIRWYSGDSDYVGQYPGISAPPNILIKDGAVRQVGRGYDVNGMYFASDLGGVINLSNVFIETAGIMAMTYDGSVSGEIKNSTFINHQEWIFNRESQSEMSLNLGPRVDFHHNTVIGGQGLIELAGNGSKIHNNYLRNNQSVTNHYGIALVGEENSIYNNIFDPEHGSDMEIEASYNNITNNTFIVRAEVCDPEYNNDIFTTNAIRNANYNDQRPWVARQHINISGNRFYVEGRYFPNYPQCQAVANAFFVDTGLYNTNYYEDNYIVINNTDTRSMANAFYLNAWQSGQYRRNYVISNDAIGYFNRYGSMEANAIFENNTFVKASTTVPYQGLCGGQYANFRMGYCCGYGDINNSFINNAYPNTNPHDICWSSNYFDPYSLTFKWYLDVHVESASHSPIQGAIVTAVAERSPETVQGVTGANGNTRLTLTEYYEEGENRPEGIHAKTNYTPHDITVQNGQEVVNYGAILMDRQKSITVTMQTGGACSPNGATQQCGIDTGECLHGTQTCVGGFWGPCNGAINPVDETCDGLDNDCDGSTDEYLGQTTCGIGLCQHTIDNCVAGQSQICDPNEGKLPETPLLNCGDSVDQNCDGSDLACSYDMGIWPPDGDGGNTSVTFTCNITDPTGIKSATLLTDESGALAPVQTVTYVSNNYYFFEAENFAFNSQDWERCALNTTCSDSRIDGTNHASGLAHSISRQSTSGTFPMTILHDILAGTYTLFGRGFQRDGTPARQWGVSIDSQQSDPFGGLSGDRFQWQKAAQTYPLNGQETISILDASPDGYWTYPDTILLTNQSTFDPTTTCGQDVNSLVRPFPRMYSLATCGLSPIARRVTFNRTMTRPDIVWACGFVDGTGNFRQSASRIYSQTPSPTSIVITNVRNSSITANSAIITWSTDHLSNSSILYNGAYSGIDDVTTAHQITLTRLTGLTTYRYNVTSCLRTGICNTSATYQFTTPVAIGPAIAFVPPTPPDGYSTMNRAIPINVSITTDNLSSIIFNWAGVNYNMLDPSLLFMMNFNKMSALGETGASVIAVDSTGKYDGTCTNMGAACLWNPSGRYGGAMEFDGIDDYVDLGNPDALKLTGNMTAAAWVLERTFPADDAAIIYKSDPGGGWQFKSSVDAGPRVFAFGLHYPPANYVGRYGATQVLANKWYFVVGTYDATARTLHVYVNGVLDDSSVIGTVPSAMGDSSVDVSIGNALSGTPNRYIWDGLIDEARVWNRTMSAQEIQEQYFANLYRYDSDGWTLFVNQSKSTTQGLDDGTYAYQVLASDAADRWNQTEVRHVTIGVGGSNCGDADTNGNGLVEEPELRVYISGWLQGSHSLANLIRAFGEWKSGC